jgi:hypothetical protein
MAWSPTCCSQAPIVDSLLQNVQDAIARTRATRKSRAFVDRSLTNRPHSSSIACAQELSGAERLCEREPLQRRQDRRAHPEETMMRAIILMLCAAVLAGTGCSKTDRDADTDATVTPAPAPSDTAPAPAPTDPSTDPNAPGSTTPPADETTPPPDQTAPPPPNQ